MDDKLPRFHIEGMSDDGGGWTYQPNKLETRCNLRWTPTTGNERSPAHLALVSLGLAMMSYGLRVLAPR